MDLSEKEKQEIRACLDRGEPLPDKYRWKLLALSTALGNGLSKMASGQKCWIDSNPP